MFKRERFLTTGQVADELGILRWKLAYLIERGGVSGPSVTVPGRRLFTGHDVDCLRAELAKRGQGKTNCVGTAAEGG